MDEMYGIEIEDLIQERFHLAAGRIGEIVEEAELEGNIRDYFEKTAGFLLRMVQEYRFVESGALFQATLEELKKNNQQLYEDIFPVNYDKSYANPSYATAQLGREYGQLLSFLAAELRSLIVFAYEQDLMEMTIRMELFLEVYSAFVLDWKETGELTDQITVNQILESFLKDYLSCETEQRIREMLCPNTRILDKLILESDLKDLRYLYYFGEYITEDEIKTAEHLKQMSEDKIELIASTFTEGFRRGFEVSRKDMKRKKTVVVMYSLGFERVIRKSAAYFKKLGLTPIFRRAHHSVFQGAGVMKRGVYGAAPNKQFDYDHRDDIGLFMDKQFNSKRLEASKNALEKLKEEASLHAGPALFEPFGEIPFVPAHCRDAVELTEKQQKLSVEYMSSYMQMQEEYISNEEISFTIISFPVPAIGDRYSEIFDAVVEINTLDNDRYSRIQQTVIDALDQADYVLLKGSNGNRTDLKVKLHELKNPQQETNFENCVGDVNIPVGEVFTSPVLKGTEGRLHVTKVFLKNLEYRDLSLDFKDGMIVDYNCGNFEKPEENKKYIKEELMFHHETLAMGEFAIGTNTIAYAVAEKFGIGHLLPILIAEKMGPHFAVGDTCYSHEEDRSVYNPDGKEIIARENEVSTLRDTDMNQAYYNCHTDITIPYHELGELSAVCKDGGKTEIIRDGRFVLKGCEELNIPLKDLKS